MSENRDLFGKIDALFEKRAADVLMDKGLDHEDFPVLTEVVGSAAEAQAAEQRQAERRALARRLGDRRNAGKVVLSPRPQAAGENFEQLVAAVEQRLGDLFIRQQLRMEDAVRKVIREELEKGRHERGHPD